MKSLNIRCILIFLVMILSSVLVIAEPASNDDAGICGFLMGRLMGDHDKGVILPLKKTEVKMEITSGIIKADVTQVYTNDTEYPLEAIYVFPLPANATISDMELRIGNRIIKSIVQEREEARATYEKARAEGKKAALLEEERPNIFTTSVANFMPGETVRVQFSYFESVDLKEGEISTAFPMVIGQRYIPFRVKDNDDGTFMITTEVKDFKKINPPLMPRPNIDPEHRLSLTVEINGIPVKDIKSSTHQITWHKDYNNSNRYNVSLAEEVTVPDCDFDLRISVDSDNEPTLTCVTSNSEDNSYGVVTIFPPTKEKKSTGRELSKEVVFLIDTSGSMSGTSIVQAKKGLTKCLEMLRPQDTFTIVRFESDYSYFSKEPKPATPARLRRARKYIDGLQASGGTEMQKALRHVLDVLNTSIASEELQGAGGGVDPYEPSPGKVQMIIFLTDGCVGNENTLFKLLNSRLGKTRLFTFGIGSAPNEHLMKKMAEIGRGQSRFIRSNEDVGRVMSDLFKTLEAPVLTDVSIHFVDDQGTMLRNVKFFPDPCPDVFYGRPLQVIARFPEQVHGKVVVNGFYDGESVIYQYPLENPENKNYMAINKMYGRAIVDELNYKMLRAYDYEDREKIKEEIVKVGLKYQLITKFTSRVAVEERIERDPNGQLVTVKVTSKLPRGWDTNYWYPTATNDYLNAIAGLFIILMGTTALVLFRRSCKSEEKD